MGITVSGTVITFNDGTTQDTSGKIYSATAQNSTSGTSINFTVIPAGVKRVTVMLSSISTNGSSVIQLQIGSGGFETSGYEAAFSYGVAGNQALYLTTAFPLTTSGVQAASSIFSGVIVLTNVTGNTWVASGAISTGTFAVVGACAGTKTLSGTLDRVRITTVNGTDTFDAGAINILYE